MSVASEDSQRKIINRLKRARGQLDAVIEAVGSGNNCRDVVTQLAAVTHALNRAGFLVVSHALTECIADPEAMEEKEGLTKEEIEKIFLTLA